MNDAITDVFPSIFDSGQNNATVVAVMRLASGWKGDANFRPQIWRFEKKYLYIIAN